MVERTCTKCGLVKPLPRFELQKGGAYGRRAACRECRNAIVRQRPPVLIPAESKTCSACHKRFPSSDFARNTQRPDGLQSYCRPCAQVARKKNRERNPEAERAGNRRRRLARRAQPGAIRAQNLQERYKMTVTEYDALLRASGGVCAICRGGPNGHGRFHVDHDHRCCAGGRCCGKCVRGLLCSMCNWMLGSARDDVTVLRRAVEYLERFPRQPGTA